MAISDGERSKLRIKLHRWMRLILDRTSRNENRDCYFSRGISYTYIYIYSFHRETRKERKVVELYTRAI